MLMNFDTVEICVENFEHRDHLCSLSAFLVIECWVLFWFDGCLSGRLSCRVGLGKGIGYIVVCCYLFYLTEVELLVV